MKRVLGITILSFTLALSLCAQESPSIDSTQAITREVELIPDSQVIATPAQMADTELVPDSSIIEQDMPYSTGIDSVYVSRLSAIVSPIEFPYNDKVRSLIEFYINRKPVLVSNMIGLSDYYFPIFEAELDAAGLPLELKYLPIIESALNPRAFSRAGASGLWQFMYSTGRLYGLKQTSYIDDRRDPIKSTKAAVRFLKDLYAIYGDWYMVIAAYNCGPGNVNKAISRSGGKRDYWEIYPYLPKETRGYAPAFIAAAYVMNYYKEHNIVPTVASIPLATDTLMISKPLHFDQIAYVTNISKETLRDLNPQYRIDIIPAEKASYALRIPFNTTNRFISYEDSIFAYNRQAFFPKDRLIVNPSEKSYSSAAPKGKTKLFYTIKSGDALGAIATWYNVSVHDLRGWNDIHGNNIKAGRKLVIFVPNNKAAYYQKVDSLSLEEKQAMVGKPVPVNAVATTQTTPFVPTEGSQFDYYVVRSGDNLWSIAKKYPGVSNTDLMKWNELTSSSKLNVGQKLKVYKKI